MLSPRIPTSPLSESTVVLHSLQIFPPSKVPKIFTVQDKRIAKRSLGKPDSDSCSKRICLDERGTPPQNDDGGCVITGASGPNIYYVYNPGNATIQRYWCGLLNLQYVHR